MDPAFVGTAQTISRASEDAIDTKLKRIIPERLIAQAERVVTLGFAGSPVIGSTRLPVGLEMILPKFASVRLCGVWTDSV